MGDQILCAYLLDSTGTVVASAGVPETAKVNSAPFWTAVSAGKTYYGDCEISGITGKPSLIIAAPTKSDAGSFTGAVVQEISADQDESMVLTLTTESGRTLLVFTSAWIESTWDDLPDDEDD